MARSRRRNVVPSRRYGTVVPPSNAGRVAWRRPTTRPGGARTPGATRRPCSTRPRRPSSRPASRPRSATSRPGRASGSAPSTATSRRGPTSSSPSTATRCRRARRPARRHLADAGSPYDALVRWIDLFVDFLVTKHGLAGALRGRPRPFRRAARLLPRPARPGLRRAPRRGRGRGGEVRDDLRGYELMRGVGNLCAGAESDGRYDARRLVGVLVAGPQGATTWMTPPDTPATKSRPLVGSTPRVYGF